MANAYLSLAEVKTYIPPDILNSLTDNNDDGTADDSVITAYIDDALPYVQGINPSLTDDDLLRIACRDYVLMEIYNRFGLAEKTDYYRQKMMDGLRRTTGTASQADEESSTPSLAEFSFSTFDDDEMDLW
ncbi:MAG TPA: hypothetical protein PLK94_00860 [Alphaproteobacteria bacterium]|nr:hypothetical protein [Alphaproteobacteria bacterium]